MPEANIIWKNAKGQLQEFEGASGVRVKSGALFLDAGGRTRLIVAPGDWRDVEFDWEDERE